MEFEVLKGSLVSNIITVVVFILLKCIHEKCNKSKCSSLCCRIEINDESRTKEAEESVHEV